MAELNELASKIQKAADALIALKKERRQLLSELDLLRRDMRHYHTLQRENEKIKREQNQLRIRLEKLNKKLEKMLATEPAMAEAVPEGVGT